MKFEVDDHLPLVSVEIVYNEKKKTFSNVLLDTGCSSTILDADLYEEIGLFHDLENSVTRKMYGMDGTEICIEQKVSGMMIDKFQLNDFAIQLGDVREMHGFDGIIGSSFFVCKKLIIDINKMEVR
ncbi:aspartyl protease family protein [Bacillota bacterium Lsc_1132]